MSKPIPPVQKFMSTNPVTVLGDASLESVRELMSTQHIRHLPVCDGNTVLGMVTDGDLFRVLSLAGTNPQTMKARDVMTPKPYTVAPDLPIDHVVSEMAEHKLSSAVVVDNHHVVGLLTATDALRAFAELLHTRMK